MATSRLSDLAGIIWHTTCENRTADRIAPELLTVHQDGSHYSWDLDGEHPVSFLERAALSPTCTRLVIIAAARCEQIDEATGRLLWAGRVRVVAAVDRSGEGVTLQAPDGHEPPDRLPTTGGELYAAMVAAMVPAGELDAELAEITGSLP